MSDHDTITMSPRALAALIAELDGAPAAPALNDIRCSFCGRARMETAHIIQALGSYICAECVGVCSEVLDGTAVRKDQPATTEAREALKRERRVSDGLRAERDEALKEVEVALAAKGAADKARLDDAQRWEDEFRGMRVKVERARAELVKESSEFRGMRMRVERARAELAKESSESLRSDITAACEALGQSPRVDVPLGEMAARLRVAVERVTRDRERARDLGADVDGVSDGEGSD